MNKTTLFILMLFPILAFGQLTNTTFDSDISGWTNQNAATVSWDATEGSAALGALKIVAGAALNTGAKSTPNAAPSSGIGNYLLTCKVKGSIGTQIQLGIFQGGFQGSSSITLATNDWEDVSFTFEYLATSNLNVRFIAKTASATYFIDDISFTKVVTDKNLYTFDTDDVAEGWDDVSGTNSGPTSGILTFSPNADSFAKLRQEAHTVDASSNSHMRIIMQNLSTNDDQLRVIVPGGGNETISISTSDASEQTYEIDLSAVTGWTGSISQLELGFRDADNPNGAGRSSGTGDFLINSIEFYTPPPVLITSAQDGNWNNSATWTGGNIPSTTSDVQIDHVVTINGDREVNDVTILNPGSILINKGRSLTINGNLVTDATVNNSLIVRSDSDQFSSLIVNGTSTGDIRYRRYVNANPDNDLISPPVNISSFADFYNDNASFFVEDAGSDEVLFGPFDNSALVNNYVDLESTDTGSLTQGVGYRMGTTGLALTSALNFHGTVETGTVNVPISTPAGGSAWNLVGNPYTSYLNFKDFFDLLTDFNGVIVGVNNQLDPSFTAIYGYNSVGTGSDVWTIWDFNNPNYATDNITPGQGFFVRSKTGGGTVTFNPSMRTIGTSDDFITGRDGNTTNFASTIISLTTASDTYSTNLFFRDFNTLGLDPGFDTGAFGQGSSGIYTELVENNTGVSMVNQSLPYADLSNIVVPLVVNINQGVQFSISLDMVNSTIPSGTEIYLDDNVLNTSTLLNSGDYTLTPSSDLSGNGRYYLRFTNSVLSTGENEFDNIKVYALNKTISIIGSLDSETEVVLYDIQGRIVNQIGLNEGITNHKLDVSYLTSGIYVVELRSNGQKLAKKLVIN